MVKWCERNREREDRAFEEYKDGDIIIEEKDINKEIENMIGKCYKGKVSFDVHMKIVGRGINELKQEVFKTIQIKTIQIHRSKQGYLAISREDENIGWVYDGMINPREKNESFTGMKEISKKEFNDFLSKSVKEIQK